MKGAPEAFFMPTLSMVRLAPAGKIKSDVTVANINKSLKMENELRMVARNTVDTGFVFWIKLIRD